MFRTETKGTESQDNKETENGQEVGRQQNRKRASGWPF